MTRRFLLLSIGPRVGLDFALGLLGCVLAVALAHELLAAHPLPAPPVPREARPAAIPAVPAAAPATSYEVIAVRNLFSPSRVETPAGPVAAAGPKPVLHGVVLDGASSRAYLEDPQAKRTFGYAVGDTVGGGRLESIGADRVVIGRADGLLEVLLTDPSKPKPLAAGPTAPAKAMAAPARGAAAPATPGQPGAEPRSPGTPAAAPPPTPGSRAGQR